MSNRKQNLSLKRTQFVSSVIPLFQQLTEQENTRKSGHQLIVKISKALQNCEDPIKEVKFMVVELSSAPEYKSLKIDFTNFSDESDSEAPIFPTLYQRLHSYLCLRLLLLDVLQSFDYEDECLRLINCIRQTYFQSYEQIFARDLNVKQYYTSEFILTENLFSKPQCENLIRGYKICEAIDGICTRSYSINNLRTRVLNIREEGIKLETCFAFGRYFEERLRPTNFQESDLREYVRVVLDIAPDADFGLNFDQEQINHIFVGKDESVVASFQKKVISIKNQIFDRKLQSLLKRAEKQFKVLLVPEISYIMLRISKNVVGLVIKKNPQHLVYIECDVYSFKILHKSSVSKIYPPLELEKLTTQDGRIINQLGSVNIGTGKEILDMREEQRTVVPDLSREFLHDRSLHAFVSVYYDVALRVYIILQAGSSEAYVIYGHDLHILEEDKCWDQTRTFHKIRRSRGLTA